VIRFTALLLAQSRRWLAPLLFGLLYTSIAMNPEGGGSSASRAAGMLPCYVIVGCWLSIIIGSIDDDAHRELVTAVAGSRRRLHIIRIAAGLLIIGGAATAVSVVGLLLFSHAQGLLPAVTTTFALAWSGVLIGTTFGAPLHRPLIRHGATAFAISLALLFGFFVLPPMQDVLRRGSLDDTSRVAPLFLIATVLAVASTAVSALATEHRRT
jgi:hypothetical protein